MKRILPLLAACLLSMAATDTIIYHSPALQLRLVADNPATDSEPLTLVEPLTHSAPPVVLNVQKEVLLDQTAVKNAMVEVNARGDAVIDIQFTDDGAKRFADVTRECVGKQLAIVIGGRLYSAPRINSEIDGGNAQISGSFTKQEARNLVARITGRPANEHDSLLGELPSGGTIAFYGVGLLFLAAVGAAAWVITRRKNAPPVV